MGETISKLTSKNGQATDKQMQHVRIENLEKQLKEFEKKNKENIQQIDKYKNEKEKLCETFNTKAPPPPPPLNRGGKYRNRNKSRKKRKSRKQKKSKNKKSKKNK